MRRLMSTAKTTMHPAASPQRKYMLDAPAAIRQQHQNPTFPKTESSGGSRCCTFRFHSRNPTHDLIESGLVNAFDQVGTVRRILKARTECRGVEEGIEAKDSVSLPCGLTKIAVASRCPERFCLAASMSRSTSRSVKYSRLRLPTVTFTEVEAASFPWKQPSRLFVLLQD